MRARSLLALAALGLAACELGSTTDRIQARVPGAFMSSEESVAGISIDLENAPGAPGDLRKIAAVDEVGITCACRGLEGSPQELEFWLSPVSLGSGPTAELVRDRATRVFRGFQVLPDSEVVLEYDRSLELEERAELLRAAAMEGRFSLYALSTSEPFSFILSRLTVVVVFTRKG